ncbi:MAG: 2-amino-4-hydroxy-6-hydroxymethyldihydropteridine diphosphokinase [Pseudomonadota bacterium]
MPQPVERSIVNKLAYIGLGANVTSSHGPPLLTIKEAILRLAGDSLTTRKVSNFYQTPAFPPGSGPDFVNAALVVSTNMEPRALLTHLHEVEAGLGRERKVRWAARAIDIDLIAYEDLVLPDHDTFSTWQNLPLEAQKARAPDGLVLPHPRLQDRGFVLGPLCDIAPDWRHPVLGQTAQALFDALPEAERAALKPIPEA